MRPDSASNSRLKTASTPKRATKTASRSRATRCKNWAACSSRTSARLPAPLLPRWDLLVEPDLDREANVFPLPFNWLQCMDNSVDPVHFEFLHGQFGNYELEKQGKPPAMFPAKHLKIAFDVYQYGIMKRRLLEGEDPETSDDWTTGHPLIFPLTLAQGSKGAASFQFRLPVDDTHTIQTFYRTKKRAPGSGTQAVHR